MTFPFGALAPEGINLERMRLQRFQEHDNVIVSGITVGDVLEWDGTDWANIPNGGGSTSNLQALADVSLAGSVFPEVLMFEGQRSCSGTGDSIWHNAQLIACHIEPGPSPFGTAVAERFIFPETLDVGLATPAGQGGGWTNEGLIVTVDSSEVADEVFGEMVYFNHDTASAFAKAARRTILRTAHTTGTDPLDIGHELIVELGAAGGVTDLIGERLQLVITGDGDVAEAIGARIRAFTKAGAGTVTDAVSLDIEDQTIGTNDIAIRTGANQHEYNTVGYLWPSVDPVANEVLTVASIAAGVATLDWVLAAGGLTGSGTLNQVPLWTPDGLTLGDSELRQAAAGDYRFEGATLMAVSIDGAAGNVRELVYSTAGSGRWILRANATAEGGANAGSDLDLESRTDADALLRNDLRIIRSTGQWQIGDNQQRIVLDYENVLGANNAGLWMETSVASGTYKLRGNTDGDTLINASTGREISFRINDVEQVQFDDDGTRQGQSQTHGMTQIDDTDSPYTVLITDYTIISDTTTAAITINLGATDQIGIPGSRVLIIRNVLGANNITVNRAGTDTFEGGGTSVTVTPGNTLILHSDGATNGVWYILLNA